jgi:hypothetical protein
VDSPIKVTRSNGRVTIGGDAGTSAGLTVTRAGSGTAMVIDTYLAGVGGTGITGYQHLSADTTSIALSTRVTTDTIDRLRVYADGKHELGPGNAGRDTNFYRSAADTLTTDDTFTSGANIKMTAAGGGLYVKEGTNATMGAATLVAGTVTVNTTKVTANSRIFLSGQNSNGTHGEVTVSARTAGTSFTITSSNAADTRSVAWMIVEPS